MTEQDLIKAASDVLETFNRSDWEASAAFLCADCIFDEVGSGRRLKGAAPIINVMQGWKQAMPDVTATVTNGIASGSTVVLEVSWHGTFTGPMPTPGGSLPPTGKQHTTPTAMIFDFEGDKIKECRNYFDMLSFQRHLGISPG